MKLMIASDIHGSLKYLNQLLDCYNSEKPDKLVLLGDILYHGPRNDLPKEYAPKEVIALLNDLKNEIICVRGNCDTEVDQMVLDFPILSDYAVIYADGKTIYATHGHKYGEDNPPPLSEGDFLLCGHTHIPVFENKGKFTYVNPGSVSIPKNDSENSYVIFENGKFASDGFVQGARCVL